MLKQVIDMYHLLDNEYIEFAKATFDNLGDFIQTNFDNGEEGSVLRRKDKLYMQGKRPVDSMIKFKTEELHDVICIQNIPFHTAAFYFGSSKRTKRTAKAHEYLLVWRKIK
jgi:hypothetical protein